MPSGYVPEQYQLNIPEFYPETVDQHRNNLTEIDRWAHDIPLPEMGTTTFSGAGPTAGGGVVEVDRDVISRYNKVQVVVWLTGIGVTDDTGHGILTVTLRINTASGGVRTQPYDYDGEGSIISQAIAQTVETTSTLSLNTIPIQVELTADTLDFVVGGTLTWLILPAE